MFEIYKNSNTYYETMLNIFFAKIIEQAKLSHHNIVILTST